MPSQVFWLALAVASATTSYGIDAPPPPSSSREPAQRTVKSQLKEALKSVGKKCLVAAKGRPLLEAVALSEFSLSPLIVDSSAFDVNISQVSVKNLNRFTVTEIERIFGDDRGSNGKLIISYRR